MVLLHLLSLLAHAESLECGFYFLYWQGLVELQVVDCSAAGALLLFDFVFSELVLRRQVIVWQQVQLGIFEQSLVKSVGFTFHIAL